jgi:hypothetical protein
MASTELCHLGQFLTISQTAYVIPVVREHFKTKVTDSHVFSLFRKISWQALPTLGHPNYTLPCWYALLIVSGVICKEICERYCNLLRCSLTEHYSGFLEMWWRYIDYRRHQIFNGPSVFCHWFIFFV